jgi:hypothetical protein
MQEAVSLPDAVAAQRAEVRRCKAALRDTREAVQTAATRLAALEKKCAELGIGFVR